MKNLQEQILRIIKEELLFEEVKSEEMKDETSIYGKLLSSISRFVRGEELHNFLKKIQTVVSFDDFSLRYSRGTDGSNQIIIDIIDNTTNDKVGRFVAFVYKDSMTGLFSLQIQKVDIYPKYRGRGIMRKFYIDFNQWLKDNFENFDMFTSDFIFLYNTQTGQYDGFNMWEDLVSKGLAVRLGPDEDYIPPTEVPEKNMWKIKSGYKLI
jgi:uncharacterized FlaG/YvyC family protein